MRKWTSLVLAIAAFLALGAPPAAQISIPNTFTFGTTIDQDQVNSNFTTVGNAALNRTGGTLTGNLTVNGGVTIDGVDISAFLSAAQVLAPVVGSAGTPSFAMATDTNTGMFFSAADQLAWSLGGTKKLELLATGLVITNNVTAVDGTLSGNASVTGTSLLTGKVTAPNSVLSLRGVDYTLPAANASGALTNNGSGTLSWTSPAVTSALLDGTNHTDTLAGAVVRGDVVVGNATPKWARVAIGTASKEFRSDGTDAGWSWPSVSAQSGTFTATDSADYYIVSAAATVNLPTCSGRSGKWFHVKSTTTGTITIDPNGAETIDGAATYAFTQQYAAVSMVCDGTTWSLF